jgi:hypothetical protein
MKYLSVTLMTILMSMLMSACATGHKNIVIKDKITEPKVIAMSAPRTPWVTEIENRLRSKGFKVLRYASLKNIQERTSDTTKEEYRASTTRYVLEVDGYAPLNVAHKCVGGGYNFDNINADLIDTKTNETILTVSGSGYSENCPPLSGSIFRDIVDTVDNAWMS